MRRIAGLLRRLRREQSGQSLVELALALPVLLTVICGIIELGWVCSNKLMLENICREGVRYGITYSASGGNSDMVRQRITELAPENVRSALTVDVAYSDATDIRSGDMLVTVTYDMPTITPLMEIFSGETVQLETSCTMKMG